MKHDARPAQRLHRFISLASAMLAAVIFLIDLQFPLGFNIPALYFAPLLLSLWQLHGRDTFIAAAGCSGLTVLGALWSPPGADPSVGVTNRILAVLGLWVVALMVARFKQTLAEQQLISTRLRDNEALLERSQEVARLGSFEVELADAAAGQWSAEMFRILDLDPAEGPLSTDQYIERIVHEDDRDLVRRQFDATVRRGVRFDLHHRVRTPGGQLKHVHGIADSLSGADGRVTRIVGTIQDVTDRVEAEQAVRSGDKHLRAILETAADAVIVIDADGVVLLANPAVERLFGYTAEEVIGRNVSALMASPDRERHDGYIARYLATGDRRAIGRGREGLGQRKDGTTLPVAIAVSEMSLDGEHRFTGFIRDLTEQKKIEAQLRERSELARIGQLASVVAHEVRNPLAGIRGALQVIGARMPVDSRDRIVIRDLIARLDALNEFVGDLLVFSHMKPPDLYPTLLAPLLQRLVELLRRDPQFSDVTFEIEPSDISVDIDQGQMERAFLNLLTNAAQAVKGRGRVRVAVDARGGACRISIADTGPGIPRDVLEKMFEPFFTTKHRGTGLGLPITKRAVEQHGGSIAVHSAPETGTTVVVTLPLARSAAGVPSPFQSVEGV